MRSYLNQDRERDHIATADLYCSNVTRLCEAILPKRSNMSSYGVLFLHDNIRSFTGRQTEKLLQMFKWKSGVTLFEGQIWHPTVSFFLKF